MPWYNYMKSTHILLWIDRVIWVAKARGWIVSPRSWKIVYKPKSFGSWCTLPETNIFAPENGWLEYDRFLLGWPIFRGYVSFRECNYKKHLGDLVFFCFPSISPCHFFSSVSSVGVIFEYLKRSLEIHPRSFSMAPEKWWLEDYFPFGMANFQGLCSTSTNFLLETDGRDCRHRYNVSSYRLLRPGESGLLNQWRSDGLADPENGTQESMKTIWKDWYRLLNLYMD